MPQNGYWIECIPVSNEDVSQGKNIEEIGADLYSAAIASLPEVRVFASSPERAIQELRDKLKALRHDYCVQGRELPAHDNPIRPPRNPRSTKGWISVYVQMTECCKHL